MNSSNKPVTLSLAIGDKITTISCGHVIVELIKFISYQKRLIPYPYEWLKEVVNKKKSCEDENVKDSFNSERHFRVASNALENLDFILKGLHKEINGPSIPDEVCIALGATPVSFKEVYRVLLPAACHRPQCHSTNIIASEELILKSVIRSLATSEEVSQYFYQTLPPTNLYIFIKKKLVNNQDTVLDSDNFVIYNGCRMPRNSKIAVLDLRSKTLDNLACCNEFEIFRDIGCQSLENLKLEESDENEDCFREIESTDSVQWYQSSYVMKGFKDCYVNGKSVANDWLNF